MVHLLLELLGSLTATIPIHVPSRYFLHPIDHLTQTPASYQIPSHQLWKIQCRRQTSGAVCAAAIRLYLSPRSILVSLNIRGSTPFYIRLVSPFDRRWESVP